MLELGAMRLQALHPAATCVLRKTSWLFLIIAVFQIEQSTAAWHLNPAFVPPCFSRVSVVPACIGGGYRGHARSHLVLSNNNFRTILQDSAKRSAEALRLSSAGVKTCRVSRSGLLALSCGEERSAVEGLTAQNVGLKIKNLVRQVHLPPRLLCNAPCADMAPDWPRRREGMQVLYKPTSCLRACGLLPAYARAMQ